MYGLRKVEIAYQIFDVIRRADCEYIPTSVIERVYGVDRNYLYEVLNTLVKNGILESKRGQLGGYKHIKEVSLWDLFSWFSPKGLPDKTDSTAWLLGIHLERMNKKLKRCKVRPEKLVPLDYDITDEDVEVIRTASTDAHVATDGQP